MRYLCEWKGLVKHEEKKGYANSINSSCDIVNNRIDNIKYKQKGENCKIR